jgi:Protein of unknown function (DUF2652)
MTDTNGTTPTKPSPTPETVWRGHGRAAREPRTIGAATRGFLVLADISGFTAFVTATEIEHGPPIIAALLDEVIRRIAPPLHVQDIEGDAVFALEPRAEVDPPASLLALLGEALLGFRALQRAMEADESCSCNACRSVWRLRLKLIVHYGTFLHQTVGGRPQAAGRDVILAHRLLKNGVARSGDYLLLTEPALRHMALDADAAGLRAHRERYEHFGDVDCYVGDPTRFCEVAA